MAQILPRSFRAKVKKKSFQKVQKKLVSLPFFDDTTPMNKNYYTVELNSGSDLCFKIHFSNVPTRESLEEALEYVQWALKQGFRCCVKRGDEIIADYEAVTA